MNKGNRATIFNILAKFEQCYNKAWRNYRKDFGRKDAVFRWANL